MAGRDMGRMSDDSGGVEYGLVLAFDTDEPQFTRGFALGVVWERLTHHPEGVAETVRAESAEMILRIAEAKGLPFSAEPAGGSGEWLWVTIGTPATDEATTGNG
jgi:hypothetical protein